MFSGIVETTALITSAIWRDSVLQVTLARPVDFTDVHIGDSIACDGVCLTLEAFVNKSLTFALAAETLKVTGWTADSVVGRAVNLERSLRLGDRIHGHLVNGHVDATATVVEAQRQGETLTLTIAIPQRLKNLIWPKGSIAINGVSLTVNSVTPTGFSVGLIPETLKRTNLNDLKAGSLVNLEADNMARGLIHWAAQQKDART